MKLQSLILISTLMVLSSCTREAPDMSRISLHVPESQALVAKGLLQLSQNPVKAMQTMGATSAMSKWALPAPENFKDINCFAVMINAPGVSAEPSTCTNLDGKVVASPQFFQGGFLPDTDQVIEVQTGTARTIYLVGFYTSSPSQCVNLAGNTSAQRFLSDQFSPPVIISQRTVDLPGGDISVDMPVTEVLSSANRFEDCVPAAFSTDVAPSEPTAIISDFPASTSLSANSFTISGVYTYEYDAEFVVNGAGDCSDAVFDGSYVSASTPLIVEFANDGNYDLCIKARSASGKVQSVPSRKSWARDTQPPGAPGLATMPSVGTDPTPEINVTYLPEGSASIVFYRVMGCADEIYRTAISTPGPVSVPATEGTNEYYARVFDAAGNAGACTSVARTYILDTTPPPAPASLSARFGVSLEYTPYFTWSSGGDGLYGSGVARYEVAIGTSLAQLGSWSSQGSSLSVYMAVTDFFLDKTTYYFSVRAVDAAGNIGYSATQPFYVDVGARWAQQAFIKGNSSALGDEFGSAVAIEGDTMVVGAAKADNSQADAGAVMVYKRSGNDWALSAYIYALDRKPFDNFGRAVAISGDTIVIGAPNEASASTSINNFPLRSGEPDELAPGNGAVYVYRKNLSGNWVFESYLKPPVVYEQGHFGSSVSIENDTIVVGAPDAGPGKVFVFKRSGVYWGYFADLTYNAPVTGDRFGAAVSINSKNIAVGASYRSYSGAAYYYVFNGTDWRTELGNVEYQEIKPPDPLQRSPGDLFGASLQLFGDRLVIGAPGEDSGQSTISQQIPSDGLATESGAAYVYRFNLAGFELENFLKAPNNRPANGFGTSVGIFGTTVVVGAPGEADCNSTSSYAAEEMGTYYNCFDSGAVYVFQGGTGASWKWTNFFKPTYNSATKTEEFGHAVAISGSSIAIGAIGEASELSGVIYNGTEADTTVGDGYEYSGAAYVFDVYNALLPTAVIGPAEQQVN